MYVRALPLQVVERCVAMASLLGCLLALLLGLGRDAIPAAFTGDAAVLALVGSTIPFVIATQPVNALAFVWDGVLFGAGGFR
jgi:Na+-driven multidrug efflux pump